MTTLALQNPHERDKNLVFDPIEHRYTNGETYTSVTVWVKSQFEAFNPYTISERVVTNARSKYWGLRPDEVRAKWDENREQQAAKGTELHARIENFHNDPTLPPNYTLGDLVKRWLQNWHEEPTPIAPDWLQFLNFAVDHHAWIPFRSEWRVYSERFKIAGTIDMLYFDPKTNEYVMVDWKRSKSVDCVSPYGKICKILDMSDSPHTKYLLQLNLYKIILKDCYDINVPRMYIVRMSDELQQYEMIDMPDISGIIRSELIATRV